MILKLGYPKLSQNTPPAFDIWRMQSVSYLMKRSPCAVVAGVCHCVIGAISIISAAACRACLQRESCSDLGVVDVAVVAVFAVFAAVAVCSYCNVAVTFVAAVVLLLSLWSLFLRGALLLLLLVS